MSALNTLLENPQQAITQGMSFVKSLGTPEGMQHDYSTITCTSVGTPDPFVNLCRGQFYFTFTTGNRIEVWSSRSLLNIESTSSRHVIWTPPPNTNASADLWAPELHALHGRWYVYYAAAHPAQGNKSHRMYVLGGPKATDDPCAGPWEFLGRMHGSPEQWAIDATVFELNNELYFVYSGWPLDNHNNSDLVQQLFIIKLANPTTVASGSHPVMICCPDNGWEFSRDGNGDHGINEGPQWLASPDGSWKGIVYSCAGSWTHEYKMATLQYVGGDPLDPRAWRKGTQPLIQTKDHSKGPYGPGHGSFLDLEGEIIGVYHATDKPTDGWQNRRARIQRVSFTEHGPSMGKPFHMATGEAGGSSSLKAKIKAKIEAKLGMEKSSPEREDKLRAMMDGRNFTGNGATREP